MSEPQQFLSKEEINHNISNSLEARNTPYATGIESMEPKIIQWDRVSRSLKKIEIWERNMQNMEYYRF